MEAVCSFIYSTCRSTDMFIGRMKFMEKSRGNRQQQSAYEMM
jgi:hypothetical protein